MPGSDFRLLPRLPLEFKTYKVISPGKIGKAMTEGWSPVASVNFESYKEGVGQLTQTRFLIGKGVKAGAIPKAGPVPVLMFPQPEGEEQEQVQNTEQVQQVLDRMAQMDQKEILELHAELQQKAAAAASATTDEGVDEVTEAMDELLDDDDDDGSEDDDE